MKILTVFFFFYLENIELHYIAVYHFGQIYVVCYK